MREDVTSMREEIVNDSLDYTVFSWSQQKGIKPLAIERAKGVYIYDYNGKRYIDFSSALMNVNIGYGDQRVTEAVVSQMQEAAYTSPSCVTKVRAELGRKLAKLFPGNLNKAFFTLCGASSNENAIKLARLYTGKQKIISRYQSYHGSTAAAMAVSGDPRKLPVDMHQGAGFVHIDIPYAYAWKFAPECLLPFAIEQLEKTILLEGPNNIAAIMLEGESGTSGCFQYPDGYLPAVRKLCDQYGILLIMDEVMSGFGRTGKWFAFQHHNIVPDMVTMAKGLTSGYLPMGCVMIADKIVAKYDNQVLPLGLTYADHATCCAAALANIRIYESDGLIDNAAQMGKYIEMRVEEMKSAHRSIGDFRNRGLLGCLEIVKNRTTKEPMAPYNAKPDEMTVMNQVAAKLKELGMYTFVRWNYIFIAPPLIINKEEIEEGLAMIDEALKIADAYVE